MNTLIYTNEYPPCNYGGAGVHVEYLTRELASLRSALGDVATRDFMRSELSDLVEELEKKLSTQPKPNAD